MDAVDGNIPLQKILLKIFVIVACVFKQHGCLFKRHVFSNTVYQGTEAFAWLLKDKRWAPLEPLVSLEQGSWEKACHMPGFAHIDPDVERFMRKHRDERHVWNGFLWACHLANPPIHTRETSYDVRVGWERPGTVNVSYPVTHKRSGTSILIGSWRIVTHSPLNWKESNSIFTKGFSSSHFSE